MQLTEAKAYRRDCLLGALGALLMLVGDLCLSIIPAAPGDSGLFTREAYLNGSWEAWRAAAAGGNGALRHGARLFYCTGFLAGSCSHNAARPACSFLPAA